MSSQEADFESTLNEEDYKKAVSDLCELLNSNINFMSFEDISKYVKRRSKTWHPDKNKDNPRKNVMEENLKRLNGAWTIFKSFKHIQDMESSDEECLGGESSYFESPYFSEDFFNLSPSKKYDFPEFVKPFFRSENCRRAGRQIILCIPDRYFNLDTFNSIYFQTDHLAIYIKDNLYLISILLSNELRFFDIKKNIKTKLENFKCNFSIRYPKLQSVLKEQCGDAVQEFGEYQKPKESPEKQFSSFLLTEYAKRNEIVNVYELMSNYAHFSKKVCCFQSPSNDHSEDHEIHFENAKKYVHLSDQKKFAKNAIEVVKSDLFMKHKIIKNSEYLENIIIELTHHLDLTAGLIYQYAEHAYFFTEIICKNNLNDIMSCFKYICESYYEGKPKNRYTALIGNYNCGKSSIAYAFLTLFSGKAINCNVDFSRIGFFLGEALHERFVLFDDVSHKGMKNLDELRDHLDGRIPVLMEKKNMQPIMQRFPAGIITSNLPLLHTLKVRVKEFFLKNIDLEGHQYEFDSNVLFIILAMWNLIPVESHFTRSISEAKFTWEKYHVAECNYCKSKLN